MLGLKRGTVRLVPHNTEWALLFEKEKDLLKKELGNLVLDIQHVGSTAVPGIPAKPIIDIAIGAKTIRDFEKFIQPLAKEGYIFRENSSSLRSFVFARGPEERRICYLHLVKYNGEIWKNYIAFRDYLKTNRKHARDYTSLKEKLSREFPEERNKYTAQKSKFIRETIKIARSIPV